MVIIWERTCFESYFWNIHSLSTHQKLEIRVSLKLAKLGSGRPIKCQEWKGGRGGERIGVSCVAWEGGFQHWLYKYWKVRFS